jgi:hypothetical protein
MRRRKFITLLGGAAAAWPLTAGAQQPERMRRIGMLFASTPDDSGFQTWIGALIKALAQVGWTEGRNLRIDTRWATANPDAIRGHATELVALRRRGRRLRHPLKKVDGIRARAGRHPRAGIDRACAGCKPEEKANG